MAEEIHEALESKELCVKGFVESLTTPVSVHTFNTQIRNQQATINTLRFTIQDIQAKLRALEQAQPKPRQDLCCVCQ